MSNIVILSGRISEYGPKLRPLPSGKWELTFTLCCDEPGRDGHVYTLYIPVLVYGAQCEPLAETLEPADVVLVTGKLSWTKKPTKTGEQSRMEILVWQVDVLSTPTDATTVPNPLPDGSTWHHEAESAPERPKGKPRQQGAAR